MDDLPFDIQYQLFTHLTYSKALLLALSCKTLYHAFQADSIQRHFLCTAGFPEGQSWILQYLHWYRPGMVVVPYTTDHFDDPRFFRLTNWYGVRDLKIYTNGINHLVHHDILFTTQVVFAATHQGLKGLVDHVYHDYTGLTIVSGHIVTTTTGKVMTGNATLEEDRKKLLSYGGHKDPKFLLGIYVSKIPYFLTSTGEVTTYDFQGTARSITKYAPYRNIFRAYKESVFLLTVDYTLYQYFPARKTPGGRFVPENFVFMGTDIRKILTVRLQRPPGVKLYSYGFFYLSTDFQLYYTDTIKVTLILPDVIDCHLGRKVLVVLTAKQVCYTYKLNPEQYEELVLLDKKVVPGAYRIVGGHYPMVLCDQYYC